MKVFLQVLMALGVQVPLWANVGANEGERIEPIGHFNKYAQAGYNDVWGYTDPQGREYALLGVQNGTSVIDLTDNSMREVGFIPSANSIWKDIKTYGHFAYVVNETGGGLQIIDLSGLPDSVNLANTYTGFSTSHNIYIDEEAGLLFAEGTHSAPVRILSLEDPVNPVQLSTLGVECHDVYARDGLLYVSEGGHGTIGIFDYSNPRQPRLVKRFGIQRAGYVHNAWLSPDKRYLMTTEETVGKTLKMFDLRDIQNPQMVGEYLAPNRLAHNTHIKGNFAYISHYGGGLRIVDISNAAAPQEVAYYATREPLPGGFVGAWGAFPFFDSGKVLMSSIEDGLFVFHYPTAVKE